ncbi:hypothetical protein SASPL_119780 [Salvia splendens]|uniref:Uncharacterized protein n=1 Tax=Salvia splendens TaxID=180675 RepID=A0A8X8ZV00_SALSN|nr:hypothetical protein SASPL_119780 [Salvia splendens]
MGYSGPARYGGLCRHARQRKPCACLQCFSHPVAEFFIPPLTLYYQLRSYPSDENVNAYWSSDTRDAGFQMIFNNSGIINLIRQNGTILRPLFGSGSLAGQFYQRLVLEHDGVLCHYVYDDSLLPSLSLAWSVRNFEPSNICHAIREDDIGGGPCVFNAYCSIKPDGRSTCHGSSGYYSRDGFIGCAPEFVQHRCDLQQAQDAQSFTFNEMSGVNWRFKDYAIFRDVEEAGAANHAFLIVSVLL